MTPAARLILISRLDPVRPAREENHRSYPMPVAGPMGLSAVFMHCAAGGVEQQGWLIGVPEYLSRFDIETGKFQEMRAITPAEVGLAANQQWLGAYLSPQEREAPEFKAKHEQLCKCYDALLAPFAASLVDVPPDVKTAARDFRALFPQVMERPLLPCYQKLGAPFFDWLNRIGQ
jgi:hypothetical protein